MRKLLIPAIAITLLVVAYFVFFPKSSAPQSNEIYYSVKKAPFNITVDASGELNAKRSIKVRGPQGMRPAGIYETTISDLIPEGTILKEGDYVATLDRTELANKMSTIQTELDKILTQLEQAKIDTAIELREIRDNIINTRFSLKEKELNVELNKFEAQSIIRQTQLDLERTQRDLDQLLQRYKLKQQQSDAKIREILTLQKQNQQKLDQLEGLSNEFTIKAPGDGMLIYSRTWNGKKEPGSRISAWDPTVAELPDLTDMISKLYVNEVDISKVQKGQDVKVKIDAFPDREYTGNVIKVANIGEQVRGYDAKVFEVIVQVFETDSVMRPAMTTSNEIVTFVYDKVFSIPLEALFSDSLTYVYKMTGSQIVRQEVIPGEANNDAIIIERGIEENDKVLLARPATTKEFQFVPIDPKVKEAIAAKLEKEKADRAAEARRKAASLKDIEVTSSDGGDVGGIIIID